FCLTGSTSRKDKSHPSWGVVFSWISLLLIYRGKLESVFCRAGAPKTGPNQPQTSHSPGHKNSWFWHRKVVPFHWPKTDPIVGDSLFPLPSTMIFGPKVRFLF